jgi:hypothetical protein
MINLGGVILETVKINAEIIQAALDNQFGVDKQAYFERVTKEPLVRFISTLGNIICFDIDLLLLHFKNNLNYHDISINEFIAKEYGMAFYKFFRSELVAKPLNVLAVIQ